MKKYQQPETVHGQPFDEWLRDYEARAEQLKRDLIQNEKDYEKIVKEKTTQ